mgnify:CR=1 FL=1
MRINKTRRVLEQIERAITEILVPILVRYTFTTAAYRALKPQRRTHSHRALDMTCETLDAKRKFQVALRLLWLQGLYWYVRQCTDKEISNTSKYRVFFYPAVEDLASTADYVSMTHKRGAKLTTSSRAGRPHVSARRCSRPEFRPSRAAERNALAHLSPKMLGTP